MKILQVIPYFVPAWDYGGPLRVCFELSKELVKRGHKVTVYTTDTLDSQGRIPKSEEEIDGIEVERSKNLSNTLAKKHNIFLSANILFAARKELQNFDVIHMHEYRTLQNVMVHYYAKKYGVPYILQAHGSLPQNTPKQKLKKLFDYLWGHKLIRDASKLIALTETEVEQYKGMGVNEDKIEIVPNGVDLAEFDDLPPRGNFRKRYGLDDSQRIILYLGRIHQTKGVDLLLKAFAGLLHHASDARLIIAGPDNGYLKTLKHLMWEMKIEEGVIYTGPLYDRDKLEAYVDADVFVTPSFSGFPMTFMEACACGVPIITTEKGDQLDWLNGQVGLVVPYDEKRLEEALRLMLSDDRMRQELNENGKSLVRERFNWTKIAEKVESIYSSCFSSKL